MVFLGAGFDTRAYRFANERKAKDVKVFEIDLPDVQKLKLQTLEKLGIIKQKGNNWVSTAVETNGVHYISCDFNKEELHEVLLKNMYFDPQLKTLVIWEGVTLYLLEESVGATLSSLQKSRGVECVMSAPVTPENKIVIKDAFSNFFATGRKSELSNFSAPGAMRIVFDYVHVHATNLKNRDPRIDILLRNMKQQDTPVNWTIDPSKMSSYLHQWSFRINQELTPADLQNYVPLQSRFPWCTIPQWGYIVDATAH
eukprot:Trichotokara_eunicae@DN12_c0_g1_i2.p1